MQTAHGVKRAMLSMVEYFFLPIVCHEGNADNLASLAKYDVIKFSKMLALHKEKNYRAFAFLFCTKIKMVFSSPVFIVDKQSINAKLDSIISLIFPLSRIFY